VHPQFYEACFTIILATSLAAYTLMYGRPGRAQRLFVMLVGSIIVWSGGVAGTRAFADPDIANIAVRVSFVGIFALPPLWYALAQHLTRQAESVLSNRRFALLCAPSVLAFIAMATNWHHLYVRDPAALLAKGPQDWAGPAFWAWAAWSYLLVGAASIRYVGWSWRLVSSDARWRGGLVCVASILPLSGNFAHLLGLTSQSHDMTPLLLGVATVMLFVANWRFSLLDTLPVARRDVIEGLRDGVVVADAEGVILDMNPAAEQMVGAPLAELRGKPIVRAVAAQSVDRFDFDEDAFNRVVVEMCSAAGGFEKYVENYAGHHFEIRGASVADVPGQISGLYIIMRDVTERSRLEDVQRESQRVQTIANLAAGITHEVNNPLSYVRANISHVMEVLSEAPDEEEKEEASEELQSVLAEALEGVDRIGAIIERVRRFTHTRAGVRESIAIEKVLEEATRIRAREQDSDIEVLTDVAPDLGPAIGFRDSLLEAVLNLIENAQHALRGTGGVIHLRAANRGNAIRIEVEDNGPGVDEDARGPIFEPFVTSGPNPIGAGLGLAISAKLIADFNGKLSYEPVDSGGARFVIEIPDDASADTQ